MRRLLPAPVSPVMTVNPGAKVIRTRSMRARSATPSSSSRPAARSAPRGSAIGHEGSSWAFSRRRSQKGRAPSGSTNRTGRWSAATVTTSPTATDVLASVDAHEGLVRLGTRSGPPVRAHDDRPDRGQVGRDGRDHEVPARRVEDRAAGRERVARRAGGAGDDQPVGDEGREVGRPDVHLQAHDTGERAARHDDVVERHERRRGTPPSGP